MSVGRRPSKQAGFSLVEMLTALAALAILFGAMYGGFERLTRAYTAENVKAGMQQTARVGVEMMVQDIRLAGLDPLGTSGAQILAATPTVFHFTADANFDGDVDDPFENIRYELVGSNLMQTNHLGQAVMIADVANLAFAYLDEAGAALAWPVDVSAVRTVVITLTLNRPAGRGQVLNRTYTTQVRCRNV
jgi:prepilin-type N-terminal cleavage/methylation domain-containing protein